MSSPRRPRSTRADVAKLAGVSPAVVSYVINGGPRKVSAGARERVNQAITALNYRPNEAARALVSGKPKLVGLLAVDFTSPYASELSALLADSLQERGFGLVTASSGEEERSGKSSPLELLAPGSIAAVVMATNLWPEDVIYASDHGLRLVSVNDQIPTPGLTSCIADYEGGSTQAVEHLLEHGRRSIGFVGGRSIRDTRHSAVLRTLDRVGLTPAVDVESGWTMEDGFRAGTWIAEQQLNTSQLDALFIASDALAFGCMAALREHGYRIPEDIAIVSFDGTALSRYAAPALTTVEQPLAEIARVAAELAVDPKIQPGTHRHLGTRLVRRASCGCWPDGSEPSH